MPLISGVLTQTGDLTGEPINTPVLMSRTTGGRIFDGEHIVQGIADILTTRIGTRVLRRWYGSDLLNLLDRPVNKFLIARIYASVITAINRCEKRVRITKVEALDLGAWNQGKLTMALRGYYRASRQPLYIARVSLDFYGENTYQLDFTSAQPATLP